MIQNVTQYQHKQYGMFDEYIGHFKGMVSMTTMLELPVIVGQHKDIEAFKSFSFLNHLHCFTLVIYSVWIIKTELAVIWVNTIHKAMEPFFSAFGPYCPPCGFQSENVLFPALSGGPLLFRLMLLWLLLPVLWAEGGGREEQFTVEV